MYRHVRNSFSFESSVFRSVQLRYDNADFLIFDVTIAAGLSFDKHCQTSLQTCFFWLRQLIGVGRSLDAESVRTLVRVFVALAADLRYGSRAFHSTLLPRDAL